MTEGRNAADALVSELRSYSQQGGGQPWWRHPGNYGCCGGAIGWWMVASMRSVDVGGDVCMVCMPR